MGWRNFFLLSYTHSVTKKNWYDLRYDLSYLKIYLKLCKNLLGKPDFPRVFLHNWRYNFEVRFWGRLQYTPSRCRQKLSTTSAHVLSASPPLVVSSAAQLPCIVSSAPLLLPCHPPPNRLAFVSPFSPCFASSTPPVHRPPAFLFDCCVLDWRRRDVVPNPMSCIVASSLSLCYLLPAHFASCSPATCLPYFLIVIYWLTSLPTRERHYPWQILSLMPVPSIFFYSVTKVFFRYNLLSCLEIVPKNHNTFFVTEWALERFLQPIHALRVYYKN